MNKNTMWLARIIANAYDQLLPLTIKDLEWQSLLLTEVIVDTPDTPTTPSFYSNHGAKAPRAPMSSD